MRLTSLVEPGHAAVAALADGLESESSRRVVEKVWRRLADWRMLSRLGPSPYDQVAADRAGNCIDLSSLACAAQRRLGIEPAYVLLGATRKTFPALMHAWTVTYSAADETWLLVDPRDREVTVTRPDDIERDLVVTALFNENEIFASAADRDDLWAATPRKVLHPNA